MQSDSPARRPGYFVAGEGAPVIMLHSSLGSKSQWAVLADRLARRFRVIAIDLCGYGDTSPAEAQEMRERERHYLRLVGLPDIAP